MRTMHVVAVAFGLALLGPGCKKDEPKPEEPKTDPKAAKEPPKKPEEPAGGPGALATDTAFAAGNVPAASLTLKTKLDIPGFGGKGEGDVKKAQEGSVMTQSMVVADERGKLTFTTEDGFIPKGTELRYNPATKKYVLSDPGKKTYWALAGAEVGNLLEGGPSVTRSAYTITLKDGKDKAKVAGMETVQTDAVLGFDWKVKSKDGEKSGKVKVNLTIWHAADAKLKEAWGKLMVDFLTLPFQDAEGQKVVDQLKAKVKFPLKWSMEIVNEGGAKEKGEAHPKLVTEAQTVDVKEVAKSELATPPAGFNPATGPYEFGQGGQTAKEDLLAKLPAKKGTPPKDVQPPPKEAK
ncbi:MAG: hypothetical protein IT371_28925 [Deltaproteobacteria bacterium]|nr:hypothetical protein [Deltaproteobacteria bacterium]